MLSPRDWVERLRRPRPPRVETPARAARASLPDVLGLPDDVRDALLDLERRGQLRRALRMGPDRAQLAARLAELVAEHGREAFRDALALIDLGGAAVVDAGAPVAEATPLASSTASPVATVAARPAAPARVEKPAPCEALAAAAIEVLGNLNVNQWRDNRTTDGWYVPGPEGPHELFLIRASVPPRLLKELAGQGLLLREAQGVSASSAMTFTIQAGKVPFRSVLAIDVGKLRSVTGASFDAIHARWDAAERKYPVRVARGEEVKHEPVT